jgi:hypothetical protein
MLRNIGYSLLAVASVLLAAACGGTDSAGSANVAAPSGTTPVAASPAPTSGVANISGDWSGRFGLEQRNVKEFSNVTTTITQNDRSVQGTLRFTTPGWERWSATFSGTLAGTVPDTQFVGTFTVQAPSSTGTGVCLAQNTFAGASTTKVMHWEAPSLTFAPNVATQPANACRGTVTNAVSSLLR